MASDWWVQIYDKVSLPMGQLRGCLRRTVYEDEYFSFERIPYAEPPVGHLRFKAPVPVKPWSGVKDCLESRVKPMQINSLTGKVEGTEDCLYLNVYTKVLRGDNPLPVMVYIYGGNFLSGEATKSLHSPDYFMKKDIVLVTLNYRVSSLGFLSVKDPHLKIPGNAGLKDQVLALNWVKNNISYFNGDPDNITVFGVNAGAASTHYMTSTPLTEGLFHKAICMSGTMLNNWANIAYNDYAYRLAKYNGFIGKNNDRAVIEFLLTLEPENLVDCDILSEQEKRNGVFFTFGPCVETYVGEDCVIPQEPREMLKSAWGNDIPIIIGGTPNEGYLLYTNHKRFPPNIDAINEDLAKLLPPWEMREEDKEECLLKAKCLMKTYFGNEVPSEECMKEFLDFYSFKAFWHGFHRSLLCRLTYAQAPTYLYHLAFDPSIFNYQRKHISGTDLKRSIAHCDDASYLWHSVYAKKRDASSQELKVAEIMIDIFTTFAQTANPNCEATKGIDWLPLTYDKPNLGLIIGESLKFEAMPEKEKLDVNDTLYETKKFKRSK